jgi:hypothetical protein
MSRPNFFNDNINRTFPFQLATTGVATPGTGAVTLLQLPDEFVADCGFIMGPESGFVEGRDFVYSTAWNWCPPQLSLSSVLTST